MFLINYDVIVQCWNAIVEIYSIVRKAMKEYQECTSGDYLSILPIFTITILCGLCLPMLSQTEQAKFSFVVSQDLLPVFAPVSVVLENYTW